MKKNLLLLAAALLLASVPAAAQDWQEALKKAAATAADKATGGKLTQYALVGTWNYTGPGVKFEGNDLLSQLGGPALDNAVKTQLEKVYLMAGIQPGAGAVTFEKEGALSAQMGKIQLSGTYAFDPATHVATLSIKREKLDLGAVPGNVYLDGANLVLVFPVTKIIEVVKKHGSNISGAEGIVSLLENYKNVYVGFEFTRQAAAAAK